jgi:hypothetical protein
MVIGLVKRLQSIANRVPIVEPWFMPILPALKIMYIAPESALLNRSSVLKLAPVNIVENPSQDDHVNSNGSNTFIVLKNAAMRGVKVAPDQTTVQKSVRPSRGVSHRHNVLRL